LVRAFSVVDGFGAVCLGGHDHIGTGLATSLEAIPYRNDVVSKAPVSTQPRWRGFSA